MYDGDERNGAITGIFYNRGYAFVEEANTREVYFAHARECKNFERIKVGDRVVFFEGETTEKGKRADRVRLVRA